MDDLTKEQRHKAMSRIRSKDTAIEVKLRKALWRLPLPKELRCFAWETGYSVDQI